MLLYIITLQRRVAVRHHVAATCRCTSSSCCSDVSLVSVTRERARQSAVDAALGEWLVEFAVNARGMLIAVYARQRSTSTIIKVKSVAVRVSDEWHFVLRSEVYLPQSFYRATLC